VISLVVSTFDNPAFVSGKAGFIWFSENLESLAMLFSGSGKSWNLIGSHGKTWKIINYYCCQVEDK